MTPTAAGSSESRNRCVELGLCGVQDYAELARWPAWTRTISWSGTPHSQRASRKSRSRSVAVKRSG